MRDGVLNSISHIYIHMLNEGILKLTTSQTRQLVGFIIRMRKISDAAIINKNNKGTTICVLLNDAAESYQSKTHQMVPIRFYFSSEMPWEAQYINNTLQLNLYRGISKHDGKYIQIIWWNRAYADIIHEWIHHKQYIRMPKAAVNWASADDRNKYFSKTDQEHMAWAAEEVEVLKQLLKTTDAKRILQQFRKMGLTNASLRVLKKQNPKAWRKILKNAIMYVLATTPEIKYPSSPRLP